MDFEIFDNRGIGFDLVIVFVTISCSRAIQKKIFYHKNE